MRPVAGDGANDYLLLERVATTALGTIHRARHVPSGRMVEVRLLQRLAEDPGGALAFADALPRIAALRHRGILPVERWGDTDGIPSVVTPAPDGEPLSDLLARAWLPDRATALRLLREIADAVDHAHAAGVVHGDLEPAAVLVTPDGHAIVAHFGLAQLAGAAPLPGGTGLRHGSPAHVAPERFPAGDVGPPADVYAFAVIGWQLLTGRVPPGGGLGPAAAGVLERGLQRDPGQRPATCRELARALDAALSGVPSTPRPAPPSLPEAPAAAGRTAAIPARTWLAAAGGVLLLVILGAVIVSAERPGATTPTANRARPGGTTAIPSGLTPPPASGTDVPSPVPSATAAPSAPPRPTAAPVPVATVRTTASPTPTPSPTGSPTPSGLAITVSDLNPRSGEANVMVSGRGYDPSRQYQIYFLQDGIVQPLFGPASPDGSGAFNSPIQIPSSAHSGAAQVAACVFPTTRCATVQVQIQERG